MKKVDENVLEDDDKVVEYTLKVIVVGELGVGKTSLIERYVSNSFTENYKATIGVNFASKVIQISDNKVVNLNLWDIGGQERFKYLSHVLRYNLL
jgi:small GTP-binding protein